jgi:hypothetical protein
VAGMTAEREHEIPAYAGMTAKDAGMTKKECGNDNGYYTKDMLLYLAKRLKQISKNSKEFKDNMLMLETLSGNRNLKNTFIEVEKMLSVIDWENLPSYTIGMEKGMKQDMKQGATTRSYEDAIIMIRKYNLDPVDVAKDLKLSYTELSKKLDN